MIQVEFMDIRDGLLLNLVMGPYESVQITSTKVRDQDGDTIADLDCDLWLVYLPNNRIAYYSDFVISEAD